MKQTLQDVLAPFRQFFQMESSSGLVLLLAAIAALLLANSPFADTYEALLHLPVGAATFAMPLEHWVNDGLMTIFFFAIGLEIKREFLYGELRTKSAMILPVTAALFGMLVPALLYSLINAGTDTAGGWGIPMATDIAFALGILSLVGRDAPLGLVVFLTALAIVDDLGAIVVIALFYSTDISFLSLGLGLLALLAAFLLGRTRFRGLKSLPLYLMLGLLAWIAFLSSGIHPTIAGVLLGLSIPADANAAHSLLHRVESALEPWSAYFIMPVFALANAGVAIGGSSFSITSPLCLGIAAGLILGKPIGIFGSTKLLTAAIRAPLPGNAATRQLLGVGSLGGIGFTMSIFIATLAFPDAETLAAAKLSILSASILSGILGALILRLTRTAK